MRPGSMSAGVVEGVLAVNKPTGITSAQVIRDLQDHFTPSKTFAATMAASKAAAEQGHDHRRTRKPKQFGKQLKAGHGGTLDPAASGVLVVGLGNGTKRLGEFLNCTKTYETVVLFGASTDTYDGDCATVTRAPFEHITREAVEAALAQFRGEIQQRPPIYSAIRIGGKRSHDIAREAASDVPTHEIEPRSVNVQELEMIEWLPARINNMRWPKPKAKLSAEEEQLHRSRRGLDRREKKIAKKNGTVVPPKKKEPPPPVAQEDLPMTGERFAELNPLSRASLQDLTPSFDYDDPESDPDDDTQCRAPAVRLRMTVASGFYVRSLAHDLGKAVGSAAFMASLVRTRQRDFKLGVNVFEYSQLESGEAVWGPRVVKLLGDWNAAEFAPADQSAVEKTGPGDEMEIAPATQSTVDKSGPEVQMEMSPTTQSTVDKTGPEVQMEIAPADQSAVDKTRPRDEMEIAFATRSTVDKTTPDVQMEIAPASPSTVDKTGPGVDVEMRTEAENKASE